MGNRRMRSRKSFRKRGQRVGIDKFRADHLRRRGLRDKKERLDPLETEDMDEAAQYPRPTDSPAADRR